MLRAHLCLAIIILSALSLVSTVADTIPTPKQFTLQPAGPLETTRNGTRSAFNVTYSQFDLYKESDATISPNNGNLTWYSRMNNTLNNTQIPGTAFRYQLASNTSDNLVISWSILIPKSLERGSTFVKFRWNGTLHPGTNATYQLLNGTALVPGVRVHKAGPIMFGGGSYVNATGGIPLTCSATLDECIIVPVRFVGFNLTLTFTFTSTSNGGGLKVQVENVMVATADPAPVQSSSHSMGLTSAGKVEHIGRITLTYNSTVTFSRQNSTASIVHAWEQMLLTYFVPASYNVTNIGLNSTYPLFQGPCNQPAASFCTQSKFLTYNMTMPYNAANRANVTIVSHTLNAVASLDTLLAGSTSLFWLPGDLVTVSLRSEPGVNASGVHSVAFTDSSNLPHVNRTFVNANKGVTYLYNITIPASVTALGPWNVTGVFLSGYDYGRIVHPITLDQIRAETLTVGGSAGLDGTLTVQGSLVYASSSLGARSINATAFAIDTDSPPGPLTTPTVTAASGLFIANISLANGVLTQNQPLTMFFTVLNANQSVPFSANVTIEHLWYDASGSHDVTVSFPLNLGDEPYTQANQFVYRVEVVFSQAGLVAKLTSLSTSQSASRNFSSGIGGVSPSRQHFGAFTIQITSLPLTGTDTISHSRKSPTYAFLLDTSLTPSRLLAFSPTFSSDASGGFSAQIRGDFLGARRLAVFVLARDLNGITVAKNHVASLRDSTFLLPTVTIPDEVVVGQNVTVTLNLRNNSTIFPVSLIVNLDVSTLGTRDSETIQIGPGETKPTAFTFFAPASAGSYLVTFSSPQLGSPIVTETLKVVLVQTGLQILIPSILGLIAALAILAVYTIRKRPSKLPPESEKTRPAPAKTKPPPGKP